MSVNKYEKMHKIAPIIDLLSTSYYSISRFRRVQTLRLRLLSHKGDLFSLVLDLVYSVFFH